MIVMGVTCEQGWLILNPDWPKGDTPHRERCPYWLAENECEQGCFTEVLDTDTDT